MSRWPNRGRIVISSTARSQTIEANPTTGFEAMDPVER